MTNLSVAVLKRVNCDLTAFTDGRDIPEDTLESFIVSLEFVYRELIVLETTSQLTDTQSEAIAIIRTCLSTLRFLSELRTFFETGSLRPVQPVQTGLVGRPRIEVSPDQLSFLIENRFSVPQVSDMIGVSVQTV